MKVSKKNFSVKFSTRGRVTIPAAVRRKFGIEGGSRVALVATPEGFLLKAVKRRRG